jgi:hypothetical protein
LGIFGCESGFDGRREEGGWVRLEREPDRTHLELVLEEIFLGGHFAVEAQQTLLLWAHRLKRVVSESREVGGQM